MRPPRRKGSWGRVCQGAWEWDGVDMLWLCQGRVKCRVTSDFCLSLFLQSVSVLPTYVLMCRPVIWYGKLSAGNVVSVRIVLVIRVWSKTVCVWWCFKIQPFLWY